MSGIAQVEEPMGESEGAERPSDLSPKEWWQVAVRVKEQIGEDNVVLVSAGVALFALLGAIPALAAAVSIYGLFVSPEAIGRHLEVLSGAVPGETLEMLRTQLTRIARSQSQNLGLGFAASLVVSLWSASKGMGAIMQACNVAYGDAEARKVPQRLAVSLGLTVGAILYLLGAFVLWIAFPPLLQNLIGNGRLSEFVPLLRWPLLWGLLALALTVLYRYAPAREIPKWRWVTWGSAIATTLWVLISFGFAFFAGNFGNYNPVYGTLGGIVAVLFWFFYSSFAVVLGAEINAELERESPSD